MRLDARNNPSFTWDLELCSVHASSHKKLNNHQECSSTATLSPFGESNDISPTRKYNCKEEGFQFHSELKFQVKDKIHDRFPEDLTDG